MGVNMNNYGWTTEKLQNKKLHKKLLEKYDIELLEGVCSETIIDVLNSLVKNNTTMSSEYNYWKKIIKSGIKFLDHIMIHTDYQIFLEEFEPEFKSFKKRHKKLTKGE